MPETNLTDKARWASYHGPSSVSMRAALDEFDMQVLHDLDDFLGVSVQNRDAVLAALHEVGLCVRVVEKGPLNMVTRGSERTARFEQEIGFELVRVDD